jgi:hypothetical protein
VTTPLSLNRSAYVLANPTTQTDPSGLEALVFDDNRRPIHRSLLDDLIGLLTKDMCKPLVPWGKPRCTNMALEFGPGPLGLGFGSESQLAKHFAEHALEWGNELTKAQYLAGARNLLTSPATGSIREFVREGGDILRYNVETNEFAVMSSSGVVRTYFRPTQGVQYWLNQIGGAP